MTINVYKEIKKEIDIYDFVVAYHNAYRTLYRNEGLEKMRKLALGNLDETFREIYIRDEDFMLCFYSLNGDFVVSDRELVAFIDTYNCYRKITIY
jgi:hypothetical protein